MLVALRPFLAVAFPCLSWCTPQAKAATIEELGPPPEEALAGVNARRVWVAELRGRNRLSEAQPSFVPKVLGLRPHEPKLLRPVKGCGPRRASLRMEVWDKKEREWTAICVMAMHLARRRVSWDR